MLAIKIRAFDNNADFLSGGKVYSYTAGTSTLSATYPTVDDARSGDVVHTNPVILDSRGEALIVLNGATKLELKDPDDNTIWTVDDLDVTSTNILDTNENEMLVFTTTASAVNELTIVQSVTGGDPTIKTTGNDTNIDLTLQCKGAGNITISVGGLKVEDGNLTITAGDLTLTSGDLNITSGDLTVTDLSGFSSFPVIPAGSMMWYGGSSAPTGWLECDGAAISRTTYAALFEAISTTFGAGDMSTTFNVPNQERRVLVGKGGTGTATLGNSIGDTGGAETHTLTEDEIPAHNHGYTNGDLEQLWGPSSGLAYICRDVFTEDFYTTNAVGGGGSHNIIQPALVLMLIIKI